MSEWLAWAAGLMVGEGSVSIDKRSRTWGLCMKLGMNDEQGVRRFYTVLSDIHPVRFYVQQKKFRKGKEREGPHYVCSTSHRGTLACMDAMWPWLEGTEKGDQYISKRDLMLSHNAALEPMDWSTTNSKVLTWDKVREIRAAYNTGQFKQSELARQFGVSQPLVSALVRNLCWVE